MKAWRQPARQEPSRLVTGALGVLDHLPHRYKQIVRKIEGVHPNAFLQLGLDLIDFAQAILHHKSRKTSFQVTFWATVACNCGALAWLWHAGLFTR